MTLLRPARPEDAPAIVRFTSRADAGLTTVPKNRSQVESYISESQLFLNGSKTANRVLFVAEAEPTEEDIDGPEILGISGIIPRLGVDRPFYSFKRSRHARKASQRDLSVRYDTLQLTTDFDGYTEVASIYLAPEARGKGVGRLLSLGRLAYIQAHRERFEARLMADIRGWVDDTGRSPFWDQLTSKFIQTDFDIADRLSASDARFIVELLPALPILLNLLPDVVGQCAGRPHSLSAGAMNLLLGAGFETTDLCDIFDGGPAIDCRTDRTLIAETLWTAKTCDVEESPQLFLHFTGQGSEFRATLGPADVSRRAGGKAASQRLGTETPSVALAQNRRS